MGNTETTTRTSIANARDCDPAADPDYIHEVLTDKQLARYFGNSAKQNLAIGLSRVKVSHGDALSVQWKLRNEYFSSWNETCTVTEAKSISIHNLEELTSKLEDQLQGVNISIRRRMEGIRWSSAWSHKVYEFTFGDNIDGGEVYFGMICLAKSPDGQTIDAISSLYKLDFTLAKEKVVTKKTFNLLGFIPVDTETTVYYRSRNLGCFTKKQITNFCRLKAMESFQTRGFIDQISYVNSLSDVND